MGNFLNFYWNKSFGNLRSQWLVILSIGISISMVVGLGYYNEAIYSYQFEESFDYIQDFEISHNQIYGDMGSAIPKLSYSYNFQNDYDTIMQIIQNADYDIDRVCQYGILSMEEAIWASKNWESINPEDCSSEFDYQRRMNATEVEFLLFDDNFYSSDRFQKYFKVIEGQAPQTESDVLVEYRFAIQHNLTVGKISNITMAIGSDLDSNPPIIEYKSFELKNVNISGIYLSMEENYVIDTERFVYTYLYQDFLDGKEITPSQSYFDEPAMFSYYNFTGPDMLHPFQILYTDILNDNDYSDYLRSSYTRSGYMILLNRDLLKFNQINDAISKISLIGVNITVHLPFEHSFVDILSYNLKMFYNDFQASRNLVRILYIPVVLFSLFMSISLLNSYKQKKIEELFYLKSIGIDDKNLKRQVIAEGIIKGLMSSILGLLFGVGLFYIYDVFLRNFFIQANGVSLRPQFSWNILLTSVILSIFISILSTLQLIQIISRMYYEDLAKSVKIENLDSKFDENMIYSKKYKREKKNSPDTLSEIPSEAETHDKNKDEKEISSRKKTKIISSWESFISKMRKTFKSNIFEEIEEDEISTNKISTKSFLLLIIGLVFILIYVFLATSNFIRLPDNWIDMINFLETNRNLFQLLFMIGLTLIIIGFIRIAVMEQPKIYARWTKFVSRFIVKDFDKYVGVRLIGKSKWKSILTFTTLLFTIIISMNMIFHSTYNYNSLEETLTVGTDLKITLDSPLIDTHSEVLAYENQLNQLQNKNSQLIVEDSMSYYYNQFCSYSDNGETGFNTGFFAPVPVFAVDIENYINLLEQRSYVPPKPDFYNTLEKLIEFNQNSENIQGIIVTSHFIDLSDHQIGDQFTLTYRYLESANNSEFESDFDVQIIGVVDLCPGIYKNYATQRISRILIDFNSIYTDSSKVYGSEIYTLLNLFNYTSTEMQTDFTDIFQPFIQNFSDYPTLNYYDLNWKDISFSRISLDFGESGFYGLMYYNFIIIGIIVVSEISLMVIIFMKDSTKIDKMLSGRGMERRNIIKIHFAEYLSIFVSSFILSGIFGIGFGSLFLKMDQIINNHSDLSLLPPTTNLPVFMNYAELGITLSILTGIAFLVYFIGYSIRLNIFSKTHSNKQVIYQIKKEI